MTRWWIYQSKSDSGIEFAMVADLWFSLPPNIIVQHGHALKELPSWFNGGCYALEQLVT